jgi:hypothetical protein
MATPTLPELRRTTTMLATPTPTPTPSFASPSFGLVATTMTTLRVASGSVSSPVAELAAPMLAKFIGNASHFSLSM